MDRTLKLLVTLLCLAIGLPADGTCGADPAPTAKSRPAKQPPSKQPATEQPATEQTPTKQQSTKGPPTKTPRTKQPPTAAPPSKQPSKKQPASEQPSTKGPATKGPATKGPSIKGPATNEAAPVRTSTRRPLDEASLTRQIDGQIQARLDSAGVSRAPQADDAEFLRRVYLDLHGVVPTAEQAARFLESTAADKRAALVDELLDSSRFGEHFGDIWRKALISPAANEQRMQTERFTAWLAQRFNDNDGWDRIVFDLLTATGKMEDNPAVTYLIEGRYPLPVTDLADLSSRYFLGIRLNCAQCHDHPFADWKRADYWGIASFFAEIQTPKRAKVVYMAGVLDDSKITMATLRDADMIEGFQSEPPKFLGGETFDARGNEPLRVSLARWMTATDNRFFARAAVNRLWRHFFGRGIVNPADDMHVGNTASHPELLDAVAREFAETGFDVKSFCRAIANSRTYQQTSRPGDGTDREKADREVQLFARMSIKVLTAEQLYDSLLTVVGPPAKTPGLETRFGPRYEFTAYFAGDRDAEPTRYDRGIPHALRMMNSPQFGRSLPSLVANLSGQDRKTDDVVDDLYLTILARRPSEAERKFAHERLRDTASSKAASSDRESSAADIYHELAWALLMGAEFSLNR